MAKDIRVFAALLLIATLLIGVGTYADDAPPVTPPTDTSPPTLLTADQLDDLLSPIALYPDALLAQILPAASAPDDIAAAAAWLKAGNDPSQIDDQTWDPSVAAIAHYPNVLNMMADYGDWTQQLGAAFANQQADVFASVQRLRAKAQSAGTLVSTPQQNVVVDQNTIQIVPADPQIIYVPVYNPQVVYVRPPPGVVCVTFGTGFPVGVWLTNDCNWSGGYVIVGGGWRYWRGGVWSPINNRPIYYPGRPGYRPGWDGHPHPWRPPPGRPIYRPPPGRPPTIPNRPGGGRPMPLPVRPAPGRPGINPPKPGPTPTPRPPSRPDQDRGRPSPGRPPAAQPMPAPSPRPAPGGGLRGNQPPGDVQKDVNRGKQSRTPPAAGRPAAPAPAPPAQRPAPAPAPRPAPAPAPRPSSPGPAFGGYGPKDSAAQDSSRGAASRGGGGGNAGGGSKGGGGRK
jgi:uncharacterized membrane protein YgcG